MDLLVPCIVEGRSELRNIGRVNCKTHWSTFSGCGTPYSLNVYIALQIKLRVLTLPAARSVECALYRTRNFSRYVCTYFFCRVMNPIHYRVTKLSKFSPMNSVALIF